MWPSFLTFIVMPEPNIVFHRELLVHVKVGNAKNRNVLALREVGGLTATAKLRNCKLCGKIKEGGGSACVGVSCCHTYGSCRYSMDYAGQGHTTIDNMNCECCIMAVHTHSHITQTRVQHQYGYNHTHLPRKCQRKHHPGNSRCPSWSTPCSSAA